MATMNSGLGGASGYGENSYTTLGPDIGDLDDGSVFVDITSVFGGSGINYFGTDYTGLYINSNGLLTFGSEETAYSPQGLANYDKPAIVPFWTDVDVSKGGDIIWDLDPSAGTFTVTWLNVAPYSGSGTNSFQVVLTDTGSGNFDIDFIFEDIQYSNGYAGHATGGLSDGHGHIYELEGSGDGAVLTNYETNDFDGGDPAGSFHMSVVNGMPDAIVVDGTSGDDNMGLGYVDAEGQEITTSDDYIDAGEGDDTIDGDKEMTPSSAAQAMMSSTVARTRGLARRAIRRSIMAPISTAALGRISFAGRRRQAAMPPSVSTIPPVRVMGMARRIMSSSTAQTPPAR